eukprot:768357-Hanusia_phi.AAC.7
MSRPAEKRWQHPVITVNKRNKHKDQGRGVGEGEGLSQVRPDQEKGRGRRKGGRQERLDIPDIWLPQHLVLRRWLRSFLEREGSQRRKTAGKRRCLFKQTLFCLPHSDHEKIFLDMSC